MPRGGRRPGAGRKPGRTLGLMERLRIGGRCEKLWRDACEESATAELATKTGEAQRQWGKAQSVPVGERRAWLEGRVSVSWKGQELTYEDYREDVRSALQQDQGIDLESDDEPTRVITVTPKRPKGLRKEIIWRVASEETERRAIEISERKVESYWKEFRRFEKETGE